MKRINETELPAPKVISADLLAEYMLTSVETALVSGGSLGNSHATTGMVAPEPKELSKSI